MENVFYPDVLVPPLIHRGIFHVEHHPGGSRIEHLHYQLGIVRWASHLVALVLAPFRQLDVPPIAYSLAWIPVGRLVTLMRFGQDALALGNKFLLPAAETAMQRGEKLEKSRREIAGGRKFRRRTIQMKTNFLSRTHM